MGAAGALSKHVTRLDLYVGNYYLLQFTCIAYRGLWR